MLFYAFLIEQYNSTQIKIFGKEIKLKDNKRQFGRRQCIIVDVKPEYLYFLDQIKLEGAEQFTKITKKNFFYDDMPENVELIVSDSKNLLDKLKKNENLKNENTTPDNSKVFTQFLSLAEQFVITKKIKGPCILEISDFGETANFFKANSESITVKETNVDFPRLMIGSCFIEEGLMKVNVYELIERRYTLKKTIRYNQIDDDLDILVHHNLRLPNKSGIWTVDTFECAKILIKGRSFSLEEIVKNQNIKDKTFEAFLSLNILDLAKELCEITGHFIHRTMTLRAERTEYLLMHTMYANNWLILNKHKRQQNIYTQLDEGDDFTPEEQTYTGGLVFAPITGLYENVILIDFNSLYPSIVIENNLCFSTRKTVLFGDDERDENQSNSKEMALLPRILFSLIDRRKNLKNTLKKMSADDKNRRSYDARQQALKITANSIYGCLGSTSRFSDMKMASFITAKGRELLLQTKQEIEKNQFNVVYGDTDSLMIHIEEKDMKVEIDRQKLQFDLHGIRNDEFYKKFDKIIQSISDQLCQSINILHDHIVIELEDIFRKIIFLSKKKYAGLTNHNNIVMKGIEKRDCCRLSNSFISEIVDCVLKHDGPFEQKNSQTSIFKQNVSESENISKEKTPDNKSQNENPPDDKPVALLDKIMSKLVHLKTTIKTLPQKEFIIERLLSKPPENYKAPQGCAHVMLALRINELHKTGQQEKNSKTTDKEKIGPFKKNDIISYIIGEDKDAYLPSEITKINYEYYLKNQIITPLFRILGVLRGLNIDPIRKLFGFEITTRSTSNFKIITPCCKNEQTNTLECLKCFKKIDENWLEKEIYKKVTEKVEILYERNFICNECDHQQQIRLKCFNCNSANLIIDGLDKKNQDFDQFLEDVYSQTHNPLIERLMGLSEYRTVDLSLYFADEITRAVQFSKTVK
ncbi:DNA polymerase (pol2) [Pseudoloma neurophilia]|uniref:DNA polymerase n=1 Tax=Pseudoloma neurophilia TaxID=146866 RepID=A0A0R0M0L0_9MICR|nr:DNA polymerase (pol2) [Pseudoloma neurophilia]